MNRKLLRPRCEIKRTTAGVPFPSEGTMRRRPFREIPARAPRHQCGGTGEGNRGGPRRCLGGKGALPRGGPRGEGAYREGTPVEVGCGPILN